MQQTEYEHALYRADQVREIERAAIAAGIGETQLMQRAAAAAWALLQRRWPEAQRVCVLAGQGNNGGDGLWLAALARQAGRAVNVCELPAKRGVAAAHARQLALDAGAQLQAAARALPPADVYVDALFGIGLNRAPEGRAAQWIEALNRRTTPVLALDLPSGLLADTGAAPGVAVRASATLSFVAWKRGLFTGHARALCGELALDTLGIDVSAAPAPDARWLAPAPLPPRARDAHKGRCGHVLVIGGEQGFAGAARLAGEAALRCGAGLVSVATRAAHAGVLAAQRPELMVHAVETVAELDALAARASVLAVGPGLGQGDWARALLARALELGKPALWDADALNWLAARPRMLPAGAVVTPHPGEAARLLACSVEAIERDRFAAARALAARYGAVAVLKGAGTLLAAPDARVEVCTEGNPGMASGGMGDVLSGVIAALMAQGLPAWEAARLGVALHARAGDLAARAGERGLLASDLFVPLRALLNGTA
ncbi:NAD(P)H-hydrate dehydratase [Metallibacterium sp.]